MVNPPKHLERFERLERLKHAFDFGSSGFPVANLANAISVQGLGNCTAEARRSQSKKFLVKKYSELSELCASVVNILSQETRKRLVLKP